MTQLCTFVGNAAASPELRFSSGGVASVRLALICQDRYRNAAGEWTDGQPHTVFVTVFRDAAERVAESVAKGDRLVVVGAFNSRKVETDGGESRWYTDFVAEDVALSTKFAQVTSRRVRGSRAGSAGATTHAPVDPWAIPTDADVPVAEPAF